MLPFVEVAHLPSASSFYAAVCQPLGLRFLSSAPSAPGPGVVFGSADPPQPAFELRAVAPTEQRPLRLSRLVLSAARPQAVNDFYLSALRASPQSPAVIIHCGSPTTVVPLTDGHGHPSSTRPSDTAAKTTDPDGNVMEVVYVPPTAYGSQQYGGSTVRRTQSTHAEVSRIMHVSRRSTAPTLFVGVTLTSRSQVELRRGQCCARIGQHGERPGSLHRGPASRPP